MKRLLLVCSLIVAISGSVMAEIVKINGLYFSLGTTTAQVVKDQSSDMSVYKAYTTVTIPASVTYSNYTYPVTSLGTSAFESCSNLQSVTLPTSITSINSDAFYGCTKLGSVNLEEGLTTIALRAFYNCNLTSVTIPSTVTSVGSGALTTVVWKPVTCTIGTGEDAPFYSTNSQITKFTFGDKVETVPSYLCKNMSKIDTIVLPPSVKSLGQYAFAFCTSLKSINLPVTQKTLPTSFLEGCSALESIELPATLTTINTDAFYGCSKLSNVNLHEGITTINLRAFYNCNLTSVTIPSTVTSVGSGAFKGNPLTTVVWKPVTCSISTGEDAPFYSTDSKVTSFTFGDQVEAIPSYLCYNMTKLDTIVLPATVTKIGSYAFNGCSALKALEFPKGITTVTTSVLEGSTALEEVFIPSTVTTINQDAFYNCKNLQAIRNYAIAPQTITERAVYNVNKQTCILYVPMDYIDLYRTKAVWCDFKNIIGVATDLQFEEQIVQLSYLKKDASVLYMETQTWQVPHAPHIEGFTFEKWEVLAGDLNDGIQLQAVYTSDQPTGAPEVFVNPANPAQKLIRRGNVYILQDGKTYNINGTRVE